MNNATQYMGPLGHGAIPSPVDARDWTLASAGAPTTYPDSCFLDMDWMIASMQGPIGCCVGCTGEEMVRQIVYLLTGKQCNPGTPDELSWRFVYAMAKCLEGTVGYKQFARSAGANDGTYPALVAQVIRKIGVPLAKFCPNDVSLSADDFCYGRVLANIPQEALDDAKNRKAGADFVPTDGITEEGIKQAINYAKANQGGVMILRYLGDTYWKGADGVNTWAADKLLPIRIPSVITSGHEESLTGYDIEAGTGRLKIYWLNHWSPGWADRGRGWEYADVWIPYIKELRVSVAKAPAVEGFKYQFTKPLTVGMKGADVVAFQHVLMLEGCFPEGQTFTGYFGSITLAGAIALQEKYSTDILAPVGLTKGTGFVGQSTLKWLASHYSN